MSKATSIILTYVMKGAFTALRTIERKEFLEINANPIAAMLVRIFQHEDAPATDRFLAISMMEGPHGPAYVQCLFRGHKALIELSPGYYAQEPGAPRAHRVGSHRLKRLAQLGFSTDDSEGNFQCMHDLDETHPQETADLMLTALFDTYGPRPDTELCWESPFVRGYGYEEFLEEGEDVTTAKHSSQFGLLVRHLPEAMKVGRRAGSANPKSRHLRAFVKLYRKSVIPFLERARDSELSGDNRCLLITLTTDFESSYARCIFLDGNETAYCECKSDFLGQKEEDLDDLFPREEIEETLAGKGFSQDPEDGTLHMQINLPRNRDLEEIAETMLTVFFLHCGARLDSRIMWICPPVEDPDELPLACALFERLVK